MTTTRTCSAKKRNKNLQDLKGIALFKSSIVTCKHDTIGLKDIWHQEKCQSTNLIHESWKQESHSCVHLCLMIFYTGKLFRIG